MHEALKLADCASFNCPPNPAVGCVIVKDNQIIGSGYTQKTGCAHAEVMALEDAKKRNKKIEGATAYVTLEPCSHWGRTPPCALALQKSGVKRVVVAIEDPNPLVSGKGMKILRDSDIEVTLGVCEKEATERNIGFICRMKTGLPFVRSKIAMSLDGKTALINGSSQWITGESARKDGHFWRARAGAILTGSGTVREDNPQMTVRLDGVDRQPLKVIVDSNLSLDPGLKIFQEGAVLLVCAKRNEEKALAFERMGVEVLELPDECGQVDLKAVIRELGQREINEVHVEAGAILNGALAKLNLIDEYLIYVAPKIIGPGRDMMFLAAVQHLSQVVVLEHKSVKQIGTDLCIICRPKSDY